MDGKVWYDSCQKVTLETSKVTTLSIIGGKFPRIYEWSQHRPQRSSTAIEAWKEIAQYSKCAFPKWRPRKCGSQRANNPDASNADQNDSEGRANTYEGNGESGNVDHHDEEDEAGKEDKEDRASTCEDLSESDKSDR